MGIQVIKRTNLQTINPIVYSIYIMYCTNINRKCEIFALWWFLILDMGQFGISLTIVVLIEN